MKGNGKERENGTIKNINSSNRLPMALHIEPCKQRMKTVAVKKARPVTPQPMRNVQKITKPTPKGLEVNRTEKTIKISTQSGDKKIKLDPSKSFIEQLAELDKMGKFE